MADPSVTGRKQLLALAALLAVNFLVLWGQSYVVFLKWRHLSSCLLPDARYYLQSLVVLVPLIPLVLLRFRHGRKLLVLLLAALVAHAGGYLAKAHIPGSRRNAHLAACDWAVETIRTDYKGPKRDAEAFFSPDEYHPSGRPVVVAHISRVPYLLGGRKGGVYLRHGAPSVPAYFLDRESYLVDVPDYIVDEASRLKRVWLGVADYVKLAERDFGQRHFVLYRRIRPTH